jgi:hypothetical protein
MMPHLEHLGDSTGKKPVEQDGHKKGSINISNVANLSIVFFVAFELVVSE